jgi:hypothetical protein
VGLLQVVLVSSLPVYHALPFVYFSFFETQKSVQKTSLVQRVRVNVTTPNDVKEEVEMVNLSEMPVNELFRAPFELAVNQIPQNANLHLWL